MPLGGKAQKQQLGLLGIKITMTEVILQHTRASTVSLKGLGIRKKDSENVQASESAESFQKSIFKR